jgi:hypothetical protein
MNNKRLIEKMKKLLAMSEGTANEHEAMVATKQLHAMLAKHNVSMSELNDQEDIGEDYFTSTSRPWKRLVAMYVAKLYFCEFINCRAGKNSNFMLVGTEANRTFAIHILQMIFKTVERESRKQSKAHYGKEVCSFVNSFWTGASNRISDRCKEMISDAKEGRMEDEEGNTLPALLSVYEQNEILVGVFMNNKKGLSTKTIRTKVTDKAGHVAGIKTGNKVQLSRTIQGNSSPKLLEN